MLQLSWTINLLVNTIPDISFINRLPITSIFNRIIDYIMFRGQELRDYTRNMARLEFEITHLCDKMCHFCEHRIQTSNYDYLSKEEYKYLVSCIKNPEEISSIYLVGGEPLCHPQFNWLVGRMLLDFPNAKIDVQTNGKRLSTVRKDIFGQLIFSISQYPNWNDDIIKKYRRYPNIRIKRYKGFWNPNQDPNLDEKTAKEVRKICLYQIRILGTKLYNCCLAEGIERDFQTDPVHIDFDENWKEHLPRLPTWKVCRHCYRATNFLRFKTLFPQNNRIFSHKYIRKKNL